MTSDPFTQIYNALFSALASDPFLRTFIQPANRVSWVTENPEPAKTEVSQADLPELQLLPAVLDIDWETTVWIRAIYEFTCQITTGDLRVQKELFPIQWGIVRAVSQAGDGLGLPFVQKVRTKMATSQMNDPTVQRGVEGWVSLVKISVEARLRYADLNKNAQPLP